MAESTALMIPLVKINVERLAEVERGIVWFIWSNGKTALIREGCQWCSQVGGSGYPKFSSGSACRIGQVVMSTPGLHVSDYRSALYESDAGHTCTVLRPDQIGSRRQSAHIELGVLFKPKAHGRSTIQRKDLHGNGVRKTSWQ